MATAPVVEITGLFNTNNVDFNNFEGSVGGNPGTPVPVAGIYQFTFQAQAMWNGVNPAPDDTLIAWGVSLIHTHNEVAVETVNHRAAPFLTVSTYTGDDQPTISLSITDTFDMALGDTVGWAVFDYNPYDAGGGDWESYLVMGSEGATYSSTFVTCSIVNSNASGGGSLTVTDGSTTVTNVSEINFTGATVTDGGGGTADVTISGGGGGSALTTTLTAGTDVAAGSVVSMANDGSGNGVQTWGPAPNVDGVVTLLPAPTSVSTAGPPLVVKLDASNFVTITNTASTNTPGAIASSISGDTITPGTINTDPSFQQVGHLAALSSTTFVYGFSDVGGDLNLAIGQVSGGVISLGTPVDLGAFSLGASPYSLQIAVLSSTSFIFVYSNGTRYQWVICTVSGTTITAGTPAHGTLPTNVNIQAFPIALDSTHVIIAYTDQGSGELGAVYGAVSGTTLTTGTPVLLSGSAPAANAISGIRVDGTHFCLSWYETGTATAYQNFAVVGTYTGTTVVFGSQSVVAQWGGQPSFMLALSATALAFFTGYVKPSTATLSGTTLTMTTGGPLDIPFTGPASAYGASIILSGPMPLYPMAATIDASSFIWEDGQWSIYQEDVSGNISPKVAHEGLWNYALLSIDGTRALAVFQDFVGDIRARVIGINATSLGPVGLTAAGASNGDPLAVVTNGECPGFTGLTPGAPYYANGDGTLTLGNIGHYIGKAKNATTMIVTGVQ